MRPRKHFICAGFKVLFCLCILFLFLLYFYFALLLIACTLPVRRVHKKAFMQIFNCEVLIELNTEGVYLPGELRTTRASSLFHFVYWAL